MKKIQNPIRKRLALAIAASMAFAMSGPLLAGGLNYTYLDAGYTQIDMDDTDLDIKGFFLRGSMEINPSVYLFTGFLSSKTDTMSVPGIGDGRVDISEFSAGVGYRVILSQQTDLNLEGAFLRGTAKGRGALSGFGSHSENGFGLALGLRHMLSQDFEVNANVAYVDIYDSSDTSLGLGTLMNITPTFGLGFEYSIGSDADAMSVIARMNF